MRDLGLDSFNPEDYIVKVADGQPDYIDGPHSICSFKSMRQCILMKERLQLELVHRSSVKTETQMLDDDPTAYTELFDPRTKYNHKVRTHIACLRCITISPSSGPHATKLS